MGEVTKSWSKRGIALRLAAAIALTWLALAVFSLPVGAEEPATTGAGSAENNFRGVDVSSLQTDDVEQLANGLAFFALIVAVAGMIISGTLWALGSKGQNPGQELTGKKGMVLCCTAAFFIGAATPMINYFNDVAAGVQQQSDAMLAERAAERGETIGLPSARSGAPPTAGGNGESGFSDNAGAGGGTGGNNAGAGGW